MEWTPMVWSYASQGVQGSQLGAVATYTLATMVVGDNRTVGALFRCRRL
jgi:hypothetical protein